MSTRIEWNIAAFRALRTDPAIVADVQSRAERIAAAAGEGHGVSVSTSSGRGRARATVATESYEARLSESQNMTLTSSVDAGR